MCFNMLKSCRFFTALTFDSPSQFLFLFTFVKKKLKDKMKVQDGQRPAVFDFMV